jgi:CheY-like chemotaxis protein
VSRSADGSGRWIDRRATSRVAATGSVVVYPRYGTSIRGRIVDLSAGGVRFALDESPAWGPGVEIEIDLRLAGAAYGWFRFSGIVARVAAGDETAVAFTAVPEAFANAVRSELRAAVAGADALRVLLVDPDGPRRVVAAAALRAARCDVTEVATPLDAISYLEDSQAHPWIVAIADTAPTSIADELRIHVRAQHALVRIEDASDLPLRIAHLAAARGPAAEPVR